jgi:hypothetical protein
MTNQTLMLERSEIRRFLAFAGNKFVSLNYWAMELMILAASYGVLLVADAIKDSKGDFLTEGFVRDSGAVLLMWFVIFCVAFMNFIWTGYIVTSVIARAICMRTLPRLYPAVLSCLVIAHIELIKHVDGAWSLIINEKLFLTWGAVIAFVTASFTVRLDSRRLKPTPAGQANFTL